MWIRAATLTFGLPPKPPRPRRPAAQGFERQHRDEQAGAGDLEEGPPGHGGVGQSQEFLGLRPPAFSVGGRGL